MGSGSLSAPTRTPADSTYRSVEMIVADAVKPALKKTREFFQDFIPHYEGTVASFLRIPTFARKMSNNQTIKDRNMPNPNNYGDIVGFVLGAGTGLVGTGIALTEALQKGNYLPLAVIVGCNVASGISELGRLSGKRNEDASTYESIEMKLCNVVKPYAQKAGEFLQEFTPWAFGGFANSLRVPSAIRKLRDGQSYVARATSQNMTGSKVAGRVAGLVTGGIAWAGTYAIAAGEATNGNYAPLIAVTGLNVLSGLFEWGKGDLFGNSKQNQGGSA